MIVINQDNSFSEKSKILIIEDERPMAEALKYSLELEGFIVQIARDGASGIDMHSEIEPDIVVLDIMLPVIDGMEVCRRIRKYHKTPIIMLTARDSDIDKILGLELGADDYVTKPFNVRELVARIRAVLRRSVSDSLEEGEIIDCGRISIDYGRHEVKVDGTVKELSPIEFRLLSIFLKNQGKAITRNSLIHEAWEGEFYGHTKTLDVHIRHLREKIEEDPNHPKHVVTVRGMGYRFEAV